MQGPRRKVIQALLYEAVAVLCVSPAFAYFYESGLVQSTTLSVVISLIAVTWNLAFNYAFERWEAKQRLKERNLSRRTAHAIGFEGGLTVLLLPVVSYWLGISLIEALVANMALFAFFLFYSFAFHWGFDKLFGLPDSAKADTALPASTRSTQR